MLEIELIIIVITSIIFFVSSLLIFHQSKGSPILEMKFLGMTFTLFTISIVLNSPLPLQPTTINQSIVQACHRLGTFCGQIGILLFCFSIILPNFKPNYRSIALNTTITTVNIAAAFINLITLENKVIDDSIIIQFHPLGIFFMALSFFLLVVVVRKRIIEVSKIIKQKESPFTTTRSLSILSILLTLTLTFMILSRVDMIHGVPTYAWLIPASLTAFYFSFSFTKDKTFFFVTPAQLDTIIITDKKSGVTLFSYAFNKEALMHDLVGSVFSALKTSIKELIKSNSDTELNQISFGDKFVLLAPGKWTTTLMIVSENNLITQNVCKYLTREFESHFEQFLIRENKSINTSSYEVFSAVIEEVRQYIPL